MSSASFNLTRNHPCVSLVGMPPVPSSEYLARFSAALVSEIKAEMGRRDLSQSALARLIGQNKQYVTTRLGAGNPRTGRRVEVNVPDLFAIAGALDLDPTELVGRAREVVGEPDLTVVRSQKTGLPEDSDARPAGAPPK